MRQFLLPSAIILSLAAAPMAMAATAAPKAAPSADTKAKTASCSQQWKAEKKHSQTRKAFMAACLKS
jgi:hypothetical protein